MHTPHLPCFSASLAPFSFLSFFPLSPQSFTHTLLLTVELSVLITGMGEVGAELRDVITGLLKYAAGFPSCPSSVMVGS